MVHFQLIATITADLFVDFFHWLQITNRWCMYFLSIYWMSVACLSPNWFGVYSPDTYCWLCWRNSKRQRQSQCVHLAKRLRCLHELSEWVSVLAQIIPNKYTNPATPNTHLSTSTRGDIWSSGLIKTEDVFTTAWVYSVCVCNPACVMSSGCCCLYQKAKQPNAHGRW